MRKSARETLRTKELAQLNTPTDLSESAREDITSAVNTLLADTFGLFMKTKNFHWHVSGPHFRDYHLLFDDQSEEVLDMTDALAERVRKLGGTTLRSISHIAKLQRSTDNNSDFVDPQDMLAELCEDNQELVAFMREVHELCDDHHDVATASLLEEFIDQSEKRAWFLFEASRRSGLTRH
ncbi:DNA protection during starvation protein [Microbulbifer sp. NBRC 101763]|uniref:Dps family protein n=1 Tax=Microbulbifer TaxID=48073 RepID=UPI0003821AC2|nr:MULTISPECIES: DNA starvation/stationary phase protection protein [Microbulbifer]WHI53220.1 DNA starvation/stationary phase protection protein [Microbulbifer sp. MLAF003]